MPDAPRSRPFSSEELARAAEVNLDRQLEWVGRYDAKSSFVLALVTAMLGALAATAPADPSRWSGAGIAAATVAVALLVLSLLFLHLGNYPKTSGPSSLLFFGSVAALTLDEYRHRLARLGAAEYVDDVVQQTHRVAQILEVKFRLLKWSHRCLFASVPFWMVGIYLLRFATAAAVKP